MNVRRARVQPIARNGTTSHDLATPETGDAEAAPHAVTAHDVKIRYGETTVIPGLDLAIPRGRVTAIVGPNGSGKSTALRALSRLQRPSAGAVRLDGEDIARLSTREVARRLAILPQSPDVPAGISVRELVSYGRYPHRGALRRLGDEDEEAIQWALDVTGTKHLADRDVDTLSGGERQRAWIAMALAQRTDILLLDEPTSYLDLRYQLDVLSLVRSLNRDHGITVAWVLHDLNQAAEYSDHVVVMHDGDVFAQGDPGTVVCPGVIRNAFGVDVTVVPHPVTGAPLCVPLRTCETCPAVKGRPAADLTNTPIPIRSEIPGA